MAQGTPMILLRLSAVDWVNPWFIVRVIDNLTTEEITVQFLYEQEPRRFQGIEREIILRLVSQLEMNVTR